MQALKKKGLTALITAILMFSMVLAVIPTASAITAVTPVPDHGPVGEVVKVSGTDATPGLGVEIYWDAVCAWDGEKGYLNETIALGDGSFECEVTIPEATAGEHWIIAFDVMSKTSAGTAFTVEPKIVLKPTAGLPEDPVTVTGTGFAGESDIGVFFDQPPVYLVSTGTSTAAWVANPVPDALGDYSVKLWTAGAGSDYAAVGITPPSGITIDGLNTFTGSFWYYVVAGSYHGPLLELRFTPETGPGHVDITVDTAELTFDEGAWTEEAVTSGSTMIYFGTDPDGVDFYHMVTGTKTLADAVTDLGTGGTVREFGDWTLTRVQVQLGWFYGLGTSTVYIDDITINAVLYELEAPVGEAVTNAVGSFEASFTVPDVAYDVYTVSAIDAEGNYATAPFTVGAAITLKPEEGPTGTVVTISGRGFRGGEITDIKIDETPIAKPSTITITAGEFEANVVIPTLTVVREYDITVTDNYGGGPDVATYPFTVTGLPEITASPKFGVPGATIAVEGVNFTQIEGTVVTLTLDGNLAGELETNAAGGVTGTFKIPAIPWGPYTLKADDGNVTATTPFLVGMVYATLTPDEGPTGIKVAVAGTGFTAEASVNGTLDSILVFEDVSVGTGGTFSAEFYVPTVAVGAYTVTIMDVEGVAFEALFTVTKKTELILTPDSAPVGYTVSIEGNYFTAAADTAVLVELYNETGVYWSDTLYTNATGSIESTFVVPPEIDLGDYMVNATAATLFPGELKLIRVLEVPFSVVLPYIEIRTLFTEYMQGDTVSFYVKATFAFNLIIKIKDPTGYPHKTITVVEDDWEPMDDWYVVPYDKASFALPGDAMPGVWNWTAYEVAEKVDTGLFTVTGIAPPLQLVITYTPEIVYRNDIVTVTVTVEGAPIAGASVTITDPDGISIVKTTDTAGTCTFTADKLGTWSVTASKTGYTDAVPVSILVLSAVPPPLPAEISEQETLDATGAPKTSFTLGETVLVSATVTNVGTADQPMLIVVQLKDPAGRALAPTYISMPVPPGLSITPSLGFTIPLTGYATGTWTAMIMVLDTWPALGGVAIAAPVTVTFTVTS